MPSITFDFLSRGAASLSRDFRSIGDDSALSSRGVKILSDVIERLGAKEDRTAAESKILATALRQTGDAADRVTAKAVLADAAIRRLGDAEQDAARKSDGLNKALGGLKVNPGLAGPALALIPALGTLTGVVAAAGIGLAGAFIAGGGALAAFGAVAKPVLTDARTAAAAVEKAQNNYTIAIANGTKQSVAYKAEQIAIGKAYAELSPAQIKLSQQIGAMASAWQAVKAAQTPVVAGALQPWLKSVTDLTGKLGPIIAAVAPVIKGLGGQFDALINSAAFKAFRDFIAGTGSRVVAAAGGTIIDLVKALMILLPKFNPLILQMTGGIAAIGPAVLKWASSQKTADQITAFMAWFKTNGPVVGGLLTNLALALKALAPGLTAGGLLELKVMSDFFGLVAKLPPNLAKPLFEVAGAMLILNKLGVIKVGISLVGLTGASGPAVAAGAGIGAGFILAVKQAIENGWKGILGILPKLFGGVGGILTLSADGWTNAILDHFATPVRKMWDALGHFMAASFDVTRGQVAGIADKLGSFLAASFNVTRGQVAAAWNTMWNNTVTRAANGVRDVQTWWNNLRAAAVTAFNTIRTDIANAWNTIWSNTRNVISAGVAWVAGAWNTLKTGVTGAYNTVRTSIASAWSTIWTNTRNAVTTGISAVVGFFQGLPGRITAALSSLGSTLLAMGKGAMSSLLSGFQSAATGILGWLGNFAKSVLNAIGSVFGIHFSEPSVSTVFHKVGEQIMQGMINGIKAKTNAAVQAAQAAAVKVSGGGGGPSSAGAAQAQAYARSRLSAYGWGADQMNPLISLWNQESGWNRLARNPSSGAYGIPQALPASKMGAAANPPTSSAGAQIDWGLGYIKGRYGSPAGAWAHEVAFNWYDRGGWLMPGLSLAYNSSGRPEQVIPGGGLAGLESRLDRLIAEVRQLTGVTAAIPAATGHHVGGAISGAAGAASFRNRYPQGGR